MAAMSARIWSLFRIGGPMPKDLVCPHCGKGVYSDRENVMWDLMRGGSHVSGAPMPQLRTMCPHCGKSLLEAPKSGSKCFIASATYQEGAEQVRILRHFRDESLTRSSVGRAFIRTYERLAPPIADSVRASAAARAAVKLTLAPIIALCRLHCMLTTGKGMRKRRW
jgi:ribosomal protein S27AE